MPYLNGGSSKLIIYFHANAEDLGLCYDMLDHIRQTMRINLLIPEYPGYGIYTKVRKAKNKRRSYELVDGEGEQPLTPSSEQIRQDAECVYHFIVNTFPFIEERDIILMGRSMGSGPAIHLGGKFSPNSLIVVSPYTSIKNLAYEKVSFLSSFIQEQFNNEEAIKKVSQETKVLFIHGKKDMLIPHSHSEQLRANLDPSIQSELSLSDQMTHNEFEFFIDLIRPLF